MRRSVFLIALMAMLIPGILEGQKNCKKGKPCGNSCIAQDKVCHVGTPTSEPSTLSDPASTSDWVWSIADRVYFKASCDAAKDLASDNRRSFSSEATAREAGFRRSRVEGC